MIIFCIFLICIYVNLFGFVFEVLYYYIFRIMLNIGSDEKYFFFESDYVRKFFEFSSI